MAFAYFNIISGYIVSILQATYYVLIIVVSFKAVQALNIYIIKIQSNIV